MEDISIEKAVVTDIDGILDIEIPSFNEDSFSKEQFKYLISKAKGVFYILRNGKDIKAYISAITNAHTRILRIYSIAVHPEARGLGYAQLLLDKVIDYAIEHRCIAIHLEVKVTNMPAIRFYEKNGFIQQKIKSNYYHDGSDAYSMVRHII